MFERIEAFFRRLEIYIGLAPNQEMMDAITTILVEVLNILAISTKEIKQGRTSMCLLYCTKSFPLTEPFSEKYLKKLVGRTDIEDALKRLDRLTQEEARMASAQLMKVTNTIDNGVREVANNVHVVDNRVAGIDDRVAGVDERVAGVDDRVACVDDRVKDLDNRVKVVDDKVAAVNDGAQYIFYLSS
jgi:archaellum component FlaC